jgi:signal peptidase I
MPKLKKLLKNDYFQITATLAVITALIICIFTLIPLRVVDSGSMCLQPHTCDGWSHPFDSTLHVGDIIILQPINPKDLNTNYPNSDIIVYQKPTNPHATPIVHRIVTSYEENGNLYFQTKGDGNGKHWPNPVDPSEYDSHTIWNTGQGVPQDMILGKVILRIPYLGWGTRIIRDTSWILPIVITLIILLITIAIILPTIKTHYKKKTPNNPTTTSHLRHRCIYKESNR